MIRAALSVFFISIFLLAAYGKEPKSAIKGVWTIDSMEVGAGENRRSTVPQAFMLFIMEKHYSAIRDFSPEPRTAWSGQPSSDKEFRASLSGFMADAGTYEYDGSTLVVHHEVAMIPNMKNGSSMTFGCQLEGANTLILTPQYDKMVVPGMNLAPSPSGKMSYGDMAVRYKFKRLE